MIALSRHCNVNRIQQTPVSYAESIVKEVKLRSKTKDVEIKSMFMRYENIKLGKVKGENYDGVVVILEDVFAQEPGEIGSFRAHYLPLLNLPEPIKKKVDKGELGISHAGELAKVKDKQKQEEVAKIVEEDGLSYRDTKEIVNRVDRSKSIFNPPFKEPVSCSLYKPI